MNKQSSGIVGGIKDFLQLEAAGGIVLLGAAVLALIITNSPIAPLYRIFLDLPMEIRIGALQIAKPMLLWINDGLMAVFFLLVGLEIKRELLEGELSSFGQALLPAIAAIGGMVVPAAIYTAINTGSGDAIHGWAIPSATDIAFALGVLSLLGNRVPAALKVFLLAVAIFDDLGAIVIIALFYTFGAFADFAGVGGRRPGGDVRNQSRRRHPHRALCAAGNLCFGSAC